MTMMVTVHGRRLRSSSRTVRSVSSSSSPFAFDSSTCSCSGLLRQPIRWLWRRRARLPMTTHALVGLLLLLLLAGSMVTTTKQQRGVRRGTALALSPSPPPSSLGSPLSRTMQQQKQQQHRRHHRHRGFERGWFVGRRAVKTNLSMSLASSSSNERSADERMSLANDENDGDLLRALRRRDDDDDDDDDDDASATTAAMAGAVAAGADVSSSPFHLFSPDELQQIRELLVVAGHRVGDENDEDGNVDDDEAALIRNVRNALPTLSPALLVKLHRYLPDGDGDEGMGHEDEEAESTTSSTTRVTLKMVRRVARAVQHVVEARRHQGAELLQQLLKAGEIRKLDSLIGKAGRQGDLDPAFFQVLQVNVRDAHREQLEQEQKQAEANATPHEDDTDSEGPSSTATRYQILSHIYTRCQEEVEKALPPGMALLNKLLRTPEASIRSNLVRHYLLPPKQAITSPDGKTITLSGTNTAPLVSLDDLISAVSTFMAQVRVVEEQQQQQQESRSSSIDVATMVESARQLCKEVLMILAESHGPESSQVQRLKEGLQPVFRPTLTSTTQPAEATQ